MVTCLNFQICGRLTALTSIQLTTKSDAQFSKPTRKKVQDVNELMQHLIDVWAEVEESVIDDPIDQRRRRRQSPCLPSSYRRTF